MKKISLLISILCICLFSFVASAQDRVRDVKPETRNTDGKVEVSTPRYIVGGVIGSVFGFGIGHGIQGNNRYADKGWIFTVGEVAGLAIIAPAARRCADEKSSRAENDCTQSEKTMIGLGYATYLGFRIWETIDVWTGAAPVSSNVSAMILPTGDSTSVAFLYKF